jgi:predicted AAA+ superfamily ATPase
MNRDIYKSLVSWKQDSERRPLLLRGARQTGKTYIINKFGENEFSNIITLNFERNPEYKQIFVTYNPIEIIEKIIIFTGKKVKIGETLIFFDEIQECPEAIMSLRYFYEEMPKQHIIGAGSLLEFALYSENFRMPVGRVQFKYLNPLSFLEFLEALDEKILRDYISDYNNLPTIPDAIHEKVNNYLRKYFMIGGMPAVIKDYIEKGDILNCRKIQKNLIESFIADFSKYAKSSKHKYLQKIFNTIPNMIGSKYIYSKVDKDIKSRDLKFALELLEQASVLKKVRKTSGAGLPLDAASNNDFFKIIFLDIGLMQSIRGIFLENIETNDMTSIYKGAVTEQFVGQELVAYNDFDSKSNLYYWVREAKGSNAEVDYLIEKDSEIIPVEVKSGKKGMMRSLLFFIDKYNSNTALKISQSKFSITEPIINIPLYALESFLKHEKNK